MNIRYREKIRGKRYNEYYVLEFISEDYKKLRLIDGSKISRIAGRYEVYFWKCDNWRI